MTTKAEVLATVAEDAHTECTNLGKFSPRSVAQRFVKLMEDLEGSGAEWVPTFNDNLKIDGAMKWLADWRRRLQTGAKTRRGAKVSIPVYAGIRNSEGRFEQARLFDFRLDGVEAHIAKVARQRDTLSHELAVYNDVAKAMREDSALKTFGDAFRKLGLAA